MCQHHCNSPIKAPQAGSHSTPSDPACLHDLTICMLTSGYECVRPACSHLRDHHGSGQQVHQLRPAHERPRLLAGPVRCLDVAAVGQAPCQQLACSTAAVHVSMPGQECDLRSEAGACSVLPCTLYLLPDACTCCTAMACAVRKYVWPLQGACRAYRQAQTMHQSIHYTAALAGALVHMHRCCTIGHGTGRGKCTAHHAAHSSYC